MKKLLILSGKGGTGKTTVASAFIQLSKAKAYADCDVDAPNLHLIMKPEGTIERSDFYGFPKAKINPDLCIQCGICMTHCRFDAIHLNGIHQVDEFACEGCRVCELVCPVAAIDMVDSISGTVQLYKSDSVFSTATLKMGSGNSGKLVTEVKKQLDLHAKTAEFAIIDGSPGIGCPVIASLVGVDMVLIVTEPSISGVSDLKRIVSTAQRFRTKIAVCINKADVQPEISKQIESYCLNENLFFLGRIPYDPSVISAVNAGKSVVESECLAGEAVKAIYRQSFALLFPELTIPLLNQYVKLD
jgi:MinD superfamily P-loop ATPase